MGMKFYILLPEIRPHNQGYEFHSSIFDSPIPDGEEMKQIGTEARRLQLLLKGEEDWELYYSGKLMDEWEECFKLFSEEYPAPSYSLLKAALLNSDAMRWEEDRSTDASFQIDVMGCRLTNHIVTEAAYERSLSQERVVLLINASALSTDENSITFSRDGGKTYPYALDVRKLNVEEIALYLTERRYPERVFELNRKHGECRKEVRYENGRKISPLKCTKEQAQKLLHLAFGFKDRHVWAYDIEEEQLMEFKRHSDFVWHGYHIDEEDERERNIPAWLLSVIHYVNR